MDRFLMFRTFEELEVGATQRTRGRTITEADVVNWCCLTGDFFYPHTDKVAAEQSMFKQRVVPGICVYALATGLGVPADSTTILANMGADKLRYLKPTWIGDTVYMDIEVLEKTERDDKSGKVVMRWDVMNQDGDVVCTSRLNLLMARQPVPYPGFDGPWNHRGDDTAPPAAPAPAQAPEH